MNDSGPSTCIKHSCGPVSLARVDKRRHDLPAASVIRGGCAWVATNSFTLEDLDKAQASGGRPYSEFLRREGFSMGMYRLGAGNEDGQHPHRADEVYLVMRGRAGLEVEGQRLEVEAGSIVSVDRGVDHHFVDITGDLQVLVIFAPPETPTTERDPAMISTPHYSLFVDGISTRRA